MRLARSRASFTGWPLTAVMTSPDWMPALAAGPSDCGSATSAPSAFFSPRLSAMSALTGWICTPIHPRVTSPLSLSWVTTVFTVSDGDRERDADRAAGGRIDRRVDADHVAVDVERRAAGIALVHRRVDLDEVVIRAGADVTATGRDDAGRDGAAEAERIADREHPVADARLLLGERHKREVGAALDLDQRDVGLRIGADHLRRIGLAVVGGDLDGLGLVDHVIVGHRVAVGRDEEAGALAHREVAPARRALLRSAVTVGRAEAAEEALHRRAGRERRVAALEAVHARAFDLDAHRDHRGFHLLDDVGKADRALRVLRVGGRRKEAHIGPEHADGSEMRGGKDRACADQRGGGEQNEAAR